MSLCAPNDNLHLIKSNGSFFGCFKKSHKHHSSWLYFINTSLFLQFLGPKSTCGLCLWGWFVELFQTSIFFSMLCRHSGNSKSGQWWDTLRVQQWRTCRHGDGIKFRGHIDHQIYNDGSYAFHPSWLIMRGPKSSKGSKVSMNIFTYVRVS